MRKRLFKKLADIIINNNKVILIIIALITIIMSIFATNLHMELSWVGLAPKGDPSQAEYSKILKNYPSVSKIYVTVQDKNGDLEKTVKKVANKLKQKDEYISYVNYKVNTDYILDNGLLFYKKDEIDNINTMLKDPNLTQVIKNINNVYEREYRGNSGNIQDDKDNLKMTLRGLNYFINSMYQVTTKGVTDKKIDRSVNRLLIGDPYLRSNDGNTILMTVQPTFGVLNFNKLKPGINAIEKELNLIEEQNPGVKLGLTGMHVVGRDEMVSSTRDSTIAMIIGMILVLIILITAFRMWISPLLAAVPLLIGIIWDMGLTSIIVGRLNLVTVFTAAILIGLGIDFSVHTLSGYTEARSEGKSPAQAVHFTLEKVGPGILTGALTTAVAFFTLTISSLGLLNELGIIMGFGILTTVISVFLVLPSLLYIKSTYGKKEKISNGKYYFLGKWAKLIRNYKYIVLVVIIVVLLFAGYRGSNVKFFLDLEKIEPQGLKSIKVMNSISKKFDMSNDAVMYTTNNLKDTYNLAEEIKNEPEVNSVNSITDYLPPEFIQKDRLKNLKTTNQIISEQPSYQPFHKKELVQELKRLNNNIIEIGQLSFMSGIDVIVNITDSITGINKESGIINKLINNLNDESFNNDNFNKFDKQFYNTYSQKTKIMKVNNIIYQKDLPPDIKNQFISKDGSSYLNSVHARGNLWNDLKEPFGKRFIHMMRDKVPNSTGTPIFMRVLYDVTKKEVGKAIGLIGMALFILLLIHFKSIKEAIIGFLPLITSLIITLGLIEILNINLDIFSVLAFPLIIGIGIDDGVHVIHRLNITNESIDKVFSSVGRAILLTTLTTIASFGSLMIAKYQGIFRLGTILFIGVSMCFIMTLLLIPIFINKD